MHHARITAGVLLVGAASAACRERPADQPRSAVARCGNRIAKGRFTLDARTDHLTTDNGANQLNGGVNGFDKALWRGESIDRNGVVGVAFTYQSKAVFALGVSSRIRRTR